ncbi:Neuropathy target esterase [Podochytrium sp. JEL0797]|nr:Neuropathy target esterase [Podochytrium sp. JEL0797]
MRKPTSKVFEVDASESESGRIGYPPFPPSAPMITAPRVKRSTALSPPRGRQPRIPSDKSIADLATGLPPTERGRLPLPLSSLSRQQQQQNQKLFANTLRNVSGPTTPAAVYLDHGLPGFILDPESELDKQLAEAVFDSISLILGMTAPAAVAAAPVVDAADIFRHRSSVDSIDSTTDDGFDSVSVSSQTSSDFWGFGGGGRSGLPAAAAHVPGGRAKDVVVVSLERGDVLVKEGERVAGVWFVIDGILEASVKDHTNVRKKGVFLVKPGNLAGYLSAVTGRPSLVTIKAKTDTQVGFISKPIIERYAEKNPRILLTLAKRLESQISPLAYQLDFALDWGHVNAGQVLYRQGDQSDSIFILLSGRLRSIGEHPVSQDPPPPVQAPPPEQAGLPSATSSPPKPPSTNKFEIYGEIGPGESLGELEVLTETPRPSTVHAIRDTEVAILPKTMFNALAIRHPEMTIQISRMLAARSQGLSGVVAAAGRVRGQHPGVSMNPFGSGHEWEETLGTLIGGGAPNPALAAAAVGKKAGGGGGGGAESAKNNFNLKTVGILPVNSMVPITQFAERLKQGLELVGASVALLNNATVLEKMGRYSFSMMGRLKLMNWLAEQEDTHRLVLYVADGGIGSQWTQRCIRQADCILLVGLGDEDPAIGEYERLVLSLKTTARKELVLLHNERLCVPGSTAAWLKSRLWIHAHHHVQMPLSSPKILNRDSNNKNSPMDLQAHFQRFYSQATGRLLNPNARTSPNTHTGIRSDFARIARRLLNKSIGLALGGGGARGIAHLSIIRALEEAGIPIDMIGGTSMGSFVAGLYARENDHVSIYGRAKHVSMLLSSKWRQFLDLTYPITSLFTGHELNRAIWKCFYETQIEDCWLPYFAVSVNITDSRIEVHRSGYMWRYIRASMSLCGYFPPLCDDGKMLVDGGYLNLVPVDVLIDKGADVAIAVDVSLGYNTSPVTYGDSLSGWWLCFARWVPGLVSSYGQIPTLNDIQDRLAFAGSTERLDKAKGGEFYLCPPVSQYGAAEFEKYQDIYQIGYKYGKEMVRRWEKEGTLERRFGIVRGKVEGRRGNRRASI